MARTGRRWSAPASRQSSMPVSHPTLNGPCTISCVALGPATLVFSTNPSTGFPAGWRFAPRFGNLKRSEEHTSELQSRFDLVCRLLLEKKNFKAPPFQHVLDKSSTRDSTSHNLVIRFDVVFS